MNSTSNGGPPPQIHGDDEKQAGHLEALEAASAGSTSATTTPDDSRRSTKVDPQSSDPPDVSGPPPLNYTIRTNRRERYIIIFFILIFIETGVLPLILFYSLRWGAHLSITKNLAIITSLIGTVSGFKLAQRSYDLWFRNGHESRRPIGSGRWGVDAFQVLISVSLFAFFVPLIIGSSLSPANVSTVAMALPCFMLVFCIPLLITGLWDRHLRIPFRVSSLPQNELLPPLTYTITEDVVAVDGGGGLMFRQAWRHRYEASRAMRRVCRVTAIAWGLSGFIVAAGCIAAAWTAPTDTAYGLGYGMPWLWAIIISAWTVHYVHDMLECEKKEWDGGRAHKEVELHLKEKDLDKEVDELQRMRTSGEAGMRKEDVIRLMKERRRSMDERRRSESGPRERTLSDPTAISPSSGSGGNDSNTIPRPRTISLGTPQDASQRV